MPDATLAVHTAQFADIIRHFIRLRPHLKTVLPEDEEVTRLIAHLMESHPQGQGAAANSTDFDLLYSVCVICSQHRGPITMGELSQALDVPFSTATRLVDWLVKSGYVARLADPEDRRLVRVTLTETGQALHQAGNVLIQKQAEVLLRRFTAAEREELIRLLDKLAQALDDET
jgi:DNA-binding MarR family transcriptional regulator